MAISLKKLMETGAHYGHQSRRWNPRMKQYLWGVQDGVHVFDLPQTKTKLEEALKIIKKYSKEGKTILFVGTKKQAKEKIEEVAKKVGAYWVNERWLGGTITNFEQIKRSTKKLADMKETREAGGYDKFTKKERMLLDREINRLERFFGGIAQMQSTPGLLIVIDIKKEAGAIKEAKRAGIETIAIVDSNSDPTLVDYEIPMNDDATRALEYVLDLIKDAIISSKKK